MRAVETAQTSLTASEVDTLVGDYLAGMSVKALAKKVRHPPRNGVLPPASPQRTEPPPGLGIDEKAEAVRLTRAGVSIRAIDRRMGVDRKAVHPALVEPNDPVTRRIVSRLGADETLWLAGHNSAVVGLSSVDGQVRRDHLSVPGANELAARID